MVYNKKEHDATEVYNATRKAIGCPEYIDGDIIIECKNNTETGEFIIEQGTKLLLTGFEYYPDGSISIKVMRKYAYNYDLFLSPKFIIDNFKFSAEDTSNLYSVYEYKDVVASLKDKYYSNNLMSIARDTLFIILNISFIISFVLFITIIASTLSLFSMGSVICVIVFFILLILGAIYKYIDWKLDNQLESIRYLEDYIKNSVDEVISGTYYNSIPLNNVKGDLL